MKKELNFIIQAKGGVGKSLLTYLLAIAHAENQHSLFVDVDSSTQTSTKQLKFLGESRTETLSLLNEKEALVRDNFISYLESLTASNFEQIFLDLGAPESEQIPALIERDIPFKEFLDAIDCVARFHIVIGGGGAYTPSIEYLKKMLNVIKADFEIVVWKSITTFNNFVSLAEELKANCKKLNIPLRQFGDFDANTFIGGQILDGIRRGLAQSEFPIGAKLRLSKELKDNFADL